MNDPHADIDRALSSGGQRYRALKRLVARGLGHLGARLLTPSSLERADVRAVLWRRGIAAQPKGFYASLIDPAELKSHDLTGLPGDDISQRRFLTEDVPRYHDELARVPADRPLDWATHPRFYLRNDAFEGTDAIAYWTMIRSTRPKRILEIGSGYSTLLAAEAVHANAYGDVTAIDPYPREFIARRSDIELIRRPAEEMSPHDIVSRLEANDILFMDSTHVVRQGGDVVWFFLEVLPQLRPGVLVHVHDVYLPDDYPHALVTQRHAYWTEQYLLYAYLLKNHSDTVLFAPHWARRAFPNLFTAAFPNSEPGGSFWLRVGNC